ncbi:MAG: glycosyltransferase family 1 protein [Verrucomicrobia bacterium]|nr:MAG: glycosyltransferase family 1 protein [Verrucomicrobiota bacterium]
MKIVVLAGFADSLVLFRRHLMAAMARAGHQVIACAPENNPEIADKLRASGVIYRPIPLERAGLNPLKDFGFFIRVTRFLQSEKPDLLLCYTIKSVIYGSFAARLARVPTVYSMITGLGYAFFGQTLRQRILVRVAPMLYRLALTHSRVVFFQNPDDRALFVQRGLVRNQNQTVLINGSGVDLDYYAPLPLPPGSPVFLLIARMLRDKGVIEYVEAARLLKKKYPHIQFRLVGPFDVNPASLNPEQVKAWHDEGVIEHQGWVADVRPALAAASVFVLPSYREGTPRTVLEAMAVGRPIATTDVPGCRETVLNGENGFLVPAKNAGALADAMERFILSPSVIPEMGLRSRKIAVEKFDVHQVNAILLRTMGLNDGTQTDTQ